MLEREVMVTVELSPGDQYGDIQVLSVDGPSVILRMPEETRLSRAVRLQEGNSETVSHTNLEAAPDMPDVDVVLLPEKPPRIIDFVELVLRESGKWSTLSELVAPMKESGWVTTATPGREEETLSSSLRKDRSGRVVKTLHGLWGLPDWKQPKPSGIRRQAAPQEPNPGTIRSLVAWFNQTHERFTIPELVEGIKKRKPDAHRATIQAELTRSFQRGEVERLSLGNYFSLMYKSPEEAGSGLPELPFESPSENQRRQGYRGAIRDTEGEANYVT